MLFIIDSAENRKDLELRLSSFSNSMEKDRQRQIREAHNEFVKTMADIVSKLRQLKIDQDKRRDAHVLANVRANF